MKRTKKKRPSPLVPKQLGKSMMAKGPARDEKHLAKVRAHECAVCLSERGVSSLPCEAHHVRCLGPRSMGKRVSDYLTVPLCKTHHAALHSGSESTFWEVLWIDPAAWIASFSAEGAAAIAALAPSNPSGGKW